MCVATPAPLVVDGEGVYIAMHFSNGVYVIGGSCRRLTKYSFSTDEEDGWYIMT